MTINENTVYQLAVVRELNENVSSSLWKELATYFTKITHALTFEDIKHQLRDNFVYPAIQALVDDEDFPDINWETAFWKKTEKKKEGEYKVSILNRVHGKTRQHPYFPYESTLLQCYRHGIAITDSEGNLKPYSRLRDELKTNYTVSKNPLEELDKALRNAGREYEKTLQSHEAQAKDILHFHIDQWTAT